MRIRYGETVKDFLLILAAAGILVVASTSPFFLINIARMLLKNNKRTKNGNIDEINLARSLAGLNKNKIIIVRRENNKFIVKLTEKGKKIIHEIQFHDMKIRPQKIWDKKWRVIVFDIPEKNRRQMRDAMRIKLKLLGFYQMQKSVWVYPYPCEKEIQLACEIYGINTFVNIITAERIYNDDFLLKYFKLVK
ncbi:MAG: hypothetical protein AAB352_01220 [Patescibacteria group bacterium]